MFDFRNIPVVIKNLLIINVIFYIGTFTMISLNFDLIDFFGLHYYKSEIFYPHQFITSMFMHSTSDIWHLVMNMLMLVICGVALERIWGGKKFILFYLGCGIGASCLSLIITHLRVMLVFDQLTPDAINFALSNGYDLITGGKGPRVYLENSTFKQAVLLLNGNMIGASGAIFGVMLAFGMLFPNLELRLLLLPFPVKAKYLIGAYLISELFFGIGNFPGDNIGHFAHLGGALMGFLFVKIWRGNQVNF